MQGNFDVNATFGLHPEVLAALQTFLPNLQDLYLNPSSIHTPGQAARSVLDEARAEIRALVGAEEVDDVIFTSGATEANNHVVTAPFLALASSDVDRKAFSLLISNVEHESVSDAAKRVSALGFTVKVARPEHDKSWFRAEDLAAALDSTVKVISLIHGQNEIGSVMPVRQLIKSARECSAQVLIHLDGVQSIGRIPLSMLDLDIDALSVSAHKLGGLSGVGALVVRKRAENLIPPYIVGGSQEHHQRAGTENLLGIYSFGVAAKITRLDHERGQRMRKVRDILRRMLIAKIPGIMFQGEFIDSVVPVEVLPNTLCVTVPQSAELRGDDLVIALDMRGLRISTGSACSSGKQEGNRTLRSLGYPEWMVRSSVRISVTGNESESELLSLADAISTTVQRSQAGTKHAYVDSNSNLALACDEAPL